MSKKVKNRKDKIRIKVLGDKILRKKLRKVEKITPNVLQTVSDMFYVLEKAHGAGLAACQIGIDKRIIVVNTGKYNERIALINPEIIKYNDKKIADQEGCLSIPGFVRWIKRSIEVEVQGMDIHGKNISFIADGVYAKALQHEIDHINGILMIDYMEKDEVEPLLKHYGIEADNIEYKYIEESKLRPVKKPTLYDAQGNLIL